MQIIRYVFKNNIKHLLNFDLPLWQLIKDSQAGDYLNRENWGEDNEDFNLEHVKSQYIPIKIIIPDKD